MKKFFITNSIAAISLSEEFPDDPIQRMTP